MENGRQQKFSYEGGGGVASPKKAPHKDQNSTLPHKEKKGKKILIF